MGSKAQVSAEFLIFVGMAFLIAIAFEAASLSQLKDFRDRKEAEAVRDMALKIQKELIIAANVENGYSRTFDLPDRLELINYSITTQNLTVTVESKNGFFIVHIPNSVGNVTKGTNHISKTGGIVHVN